MGSLEGIGKGASGAVYVRESALKVDFMKGTGGTDFPALLNGDGEGFDESCTYHLIAVGSTLASRGSNAM